jgi:hypothetical protein
MELVLAECRVVDQELPHALVPVGEHQAARPALIGEVQAVIVVARLGHPVEEVKALVTEVAARMVVDDIEEDGHAIDMQDVAHGNHAGVRRANQAGGGLLSDFSEPYRLGRGFAISL